MNIYLSLVISIIIGVFGQLSLKAGAIQSVDNKILFFNPLIFIGLLFYFLAALFYVYSLKGIPISVALPSVSISYFAVSLSAHFLWNEDFGMRQILGLLLICFGVYTLSRS